MLTNSEASKAHSLWKRVVAGVAKELPVIEKFNMYGFINKEDKKIYETIATQVVGEWVKMTDFRMFGLEYPFATSEKKNIEQFIAMIKKTENYQYYLNEYLISTEHFEKLEKYAEERGLFIQDDSAKFKKSIFIRDIDRCTTIKSETLEADKFAIHKFYLKRIAIGA